MEKVKLVEVVNDNVKYLIDFEEIEYLEVDLFGGSSCNEVVQEGEIGTKIHLKSGKIIQVEGDISNSHCFNIKQLKPRK
jgi:hypothetical protein